MGCPQECGQVRLPAPRTASENRGQPGRKQNPEQETRLVAHFLSPGEMFNGTFHFIMHFAYAAASNAG
jgi:hypothetical protein